MTERGKVLANTGFSSVGLYTEYLFGLIASIMVARALGPEDLGIYSLLVWIVSMAVIVANAGITTAAIKFIAELHGSGKTMLIPALVARLRRLQRIMLSVVVLAVAVTLVLAHDRLAPGVVFWVLGLVVASVLMRAPYMFNIALAKGAQDFRSTAIIAVVSASANLAMIAVALAWRASLPVFVIVFAVSGVVYFLVSQWRVRRILQDTNDAPVSLPADLESRLGHHLRIVAISIVLGSIGSSEIELLFLNILATPSDAGMFKVANALAMGAALLASGVLGAQLLPMMASAYGRGPEQAASRIAATTAWLFVLGAPLVALGAIFSVPLIKFLYGSAFAPAAGALSILLVARVASTLGQGASAYLVSADRQTALMQLTLLFTALRLAGVYIGTLYFGLMGAVVSSAVFAVLGTVSTVWLALRDTSAKLPWPRLLRIAAAAALAALCSMPATWLHPPLLVLAVGGIVFAVVYLAALWLMGCLEDADAEYVRRLMKRVTGKS